MSILATIESKSSAPAVKRAPTKNVIISLGIGHSGKVSSAMNAMTNQEKADFLKEMMETVNAATNDGVNRDGRDEAVKALTKLFGNEFIKHPALHSCRKLYTLDSQRKVFRCWYGPFGRVHGAGDHTHFDSCGEGLFFHAECDDAETLEGFAKLFTDKMVEWKGFHGTLWAGYYGF